MMRGSIGLIGILLPAAELPDLAAFIERHYERKPPDILLVEWVHGDWVGSVRGAPEAHGAAAKQRLKQQVHVESVAVVAADKLTVTPGHAWRLQPGRKHFVATGNLFLHRGEISSLRKTHLNDFPRCGDSLNKYLWSAPVQGPGIRRATSPPFGKKC
jgi:hypothetical protein